MLIFVAGQTDKKHPNLWLTHSVWWHWPNDITLVKMTLLVKMTPICSKWHQFAQNDTTLVKMTLLWSKWQTFFVKMASLWPKSHHFGLVTSLSDTNPLSCLLLTHLFCEVSENDYYKLFSHRNLKRNKSFKAPCPALKLSKQVRSLDCQCCPSETLCVFEKFHSGQGAPFAKPEPEETEHNGKWISQKAFGQTGILTWAWSLPNSVLCEVMFITFSSETLQVTEWMQNGLHTHRNAGKYCLHQTLHHVLQKNITLPYSICTSQTVFGSPGFIFGDRKRMHQKGGEKKCVCVIVGRGGGRGRQIMHQSACMPSRELIGFQCPVNHTGSIKLRQCHKQIHISKHFSYMNLF